MSRIDLKCYSQEKQMFKWNLLWQQALGIVVN